MCRACPRYGKLGDLRKELEIGVEHTVSWEDPVDSVEGIFERKGAGRSSFVSKFLLTAWYIPLLVFQAIKRRVA